jgi:hypothetical protein
MTLIHAFIFLLSDCRQVRFRVVTGRNFQSNLRFGGCTFWSVESDFHFFERMYFDTKVCSIFQYVFLFCVAFEHMFKSFVECFTF